MRRKIKNGLVALTLGAMAALTPLSARAAPNDLNVGNITNDCQLGWIYGVTQHMFTASAGTGGSVSSSNGWYDVNSTSRIEAIANDDHYFTQWSDGDTNKLRDYVITSPINLTANFTQVPIPRINQFDLTSIGVENLVSNLNYGIQENTNMLNLSWQDKYSFKALSTETNIPMISTNKLGFLRVKYNPN